MNSKKKLYCSPSRMSMGIQDNTCMTTDELQEIAQDYNETIEKKGLSNSKKIILSVPKKKLVQQMQTKIKKCSGDHCWVQQDFVNSATKASILKKAFRPLKPVEWYKNRQTWLNTYDILKVMKQYEDKYKDFIFLGVFPIDFASTDAYGRCVSNEMCSFHISQMKEKNKKRFGMILNLDKHDQSGSHWVAVYCNLLPRRKNFGIYYYDSVSNPPPKEVQVFMRQIQQQVYDIFTKKVADRFSLRSNEIQKQFDNYDCGVFSEVFITQILRDIPFDIICKYMKTDREINQLRDVLYTPSKL